MIPGIDVSNNNGAVTWPKVAAAGYQFAACKVSEGTDFRDSYYAGNWAAMKANGLARIGYHFAQPDQNSPEDEAAWFVGNAGPFEQGDCAALDLEAGSGNLLDWAVRWLAAVEHALGFLPFFYSSPGFMAAHGLIGSTTLARNGLWIASWGLSAPPIPPSPWETWAIWQTSSTGVVPGVTGHCDIDQFNGTIEQLRLYGATAVPVKPHLDDAARYQLIKYVAGGSGVSDLSAWLAGYTD